MPKKTIILGAILVVLGVVSYIVSGFVSWTALIPSILGVLLAACGFLGLRNQALGIHVALVVALAGLAGTFGNVLRLGELFQGTAERPLAVAASAITFVLLVVYLVVGVTSFIKARRWKQPES